MIDIFDLNCSFLTANHVKYSISGKLYAQKAQCDQEGWGKLA